MRFDAILRPSGAWVVVAALAAGIPAGAHAADPAPPGKWQFGADVYLWTASIGGESTGGDDIDISFTDLLQDLDFAFMGGVTARKDKLLLLGDFVYMDASQKNDDEFQVSGPLGLLAPKVSVDAKIQLKSFVSTLAAGYELVGSDKGSVHAIGGARYLWLDSTVTLDTSTRRLARSRRIDGSGNIWDGIVGLRGQANVNDKLYLTAYGDIGAGGSERTWSSVLSVGYELKHFDVVGGYRWMAWDFDDNRAFDTLDLSGFVLGARFRF